MKLILDIQDGMTHCDFCPFTNEGLAPNLCREHILNLLGVDCRKYDLTTIKAMPEKV